MPDLSSLVITPYDRCPSGTVLLDNCCSPSTSLYVSLDLTLLFPLPHLACLFTSQCVSLPHFTFSLPHFTFLFTSLSLHLTLPVSLPSFTFLFTLLYLSLYLTLPFSLLTFLLPSFTCLFTSLHLSLYLSLYLTLPVSLPRFPFTSLCLSFCLM